MQGSFSDDCLEVFNKLASATQGLNFSESGTDSYDFTRCVRPNGTAYGTGGKCKKGTEEAKPEGGDRRSGNKPYKLNVKRSEITSDSQKAVMTDVGTKKNPLKVKSSVSSQGGSYYVPGYSPSDTDVSHKGQHYTHTGKRGTIIKTGEPSKEFQTEGERRVYVSNSGKLYED